MSLSTGPTSSSTPFYLPRPVLRSAEPYMAFDVFSANLLRIPSISSVVFPLVCLLPVSSPTSSWPPCHTPSFPNVPTTLVLLHLPVSYTHLTLPTSDLV